VIPDDLLAPLAALDPDARVPIAEAHRSLDLAARILGDPHLGLHAATRLSRGDVGAADYLWGSGPTVRSAFEQAAQSSRLLNDAMRITLEATGQTGEAARIRFESAVALPAIGVDYMLAGFFHAHVRYWLGSELPSVVVAFGRRGPSDLEPYRSAFAPSAVRFAHTFDGFELPAELLDRPLPTSDPKLHAVMTKAAEALLAELPLAESFTDRVRLLVREELSEGNPSAVHVALRLGITERTLARRLEREGTTFKALLDGLRRSLAIAMVADSALHLSEIARRLGFSQTAAFHRAFRRWTGCTPLEHRELSARRARKALHPRTGVRAGRTLERGPPGR
jgi:AraC-like DNA-binding protein